MAMTNSSGATGGAGVGGWHVGRVGGKCANCAVDLPAGTACWAALCDAPLEQLSATEKKTESGKKDKDAKVEASPFVRVDFCEKCWGEGARPGQPLVMFSFWKTTVPVPEQKKKLLVDDSVLVDVFGRMEGKSEPAEIRFRFVLALILMRKRLLKYEGMEETEGKGERGKGIEVWRMVPRGGEAAVKVINPKLTEEQISEVSQQLSAILAEEV